MYYADWATTTEYDWNVTVCTQTKLRWCVIFTENVSFVAFTLRTMYNVKDPSLCIQCTLFTSKVNVYDVHYLQVNRKKSFVATNFCDHDVDYLVSDKIYSRNI